MNLVDSCGWLEYFGDGAQAGFYAAAIEDVKHLVVPTICVFEVFRKILKERGEPQALQAVSAMSYGRSIPLDDRLALNAAKLGMDLGLPMADSIIYASARQSGAIVWTQDEHFRNLPGVKFRVLKK